MREQFNEITAFVDASNIYGSEQEHSAIIRTYRYVETDTYLGMCKWIPISFSKDQIVMARVIF